MSNPGLNSSGKAKLTAKVSKMAIKFCFYLVISTILMGNFAILGTSLKWLEANAVAEIL